MQHLSPGCELGLGGQPRVLLSAVNAISHEWKSQMLKMDANLMGPPRVQNHLRQGRALQSLQDPVTGPRRSPFPSLHHGHAAPMGRVSCNL